MNINQMTKPRIFFTTFSMCQGDRDTEKTDGKIYVKRTKIWVSPATIDIFAMFYHCGLSVRGCRLITYILFWCHTTHRFPAGCMKSP